MRTTLLLLFGALLLNFGTIDALAEPKTDAANKVDAAKEQAPNPAAYEHADDKAKFLRDSQDMGKHKGQEDDSAHQQREDKGHKHKDKDQDQDKDKDKDKEQGSREDDGGKDKAKAKSKDKSKEKSKQ